MNTTSYQQFHRDWKKAQLKEKEKTLFKDLLEDADWKDLMYKIYIRQSIEQGLKDSEEGRVKSHGEIKREVLSSIIIQKSLIPPHPHSH